jgi:hypothetical protein
MRCQVGPFTYERAHLLFCMMLGQRLEYRQRSCGPVTSPS